MYNPIQKGIEKKSSNLVSYQEIGPSRNVDSFIHRYWEIKNEKILQEDFHFHILPDACVHIVFNLGKEDSAGISALRVKSQTLNLGRSFHFVGLRLLPGVWQNGSEEIIEGVIDSPYDGELPLKEFGRSLKKLKFEEMTVSFTSLIEKLVREERIITNEVTSSLLENIDEINSVSDMAKVANLSTRQLQRVLKKTTGFTPHDFLKISRLQKSFIRHYLDFYTDQAHYIHSFRDLTGFTPSKYASKFDV